MKKDVEFYKLDKELNESANKIFSNSIIVAITLLSIFQYLRIGKISYELFCIYFVGQFCKSLYKYNRSKCIIYLIECIAAIFLVIAFILLIL